MKKIGFKFGSKVLSLIAAVSLVAAMLPTAFAETVPENETGKLIDNCNELYFEKSAMVEVKNEVVKGEDWIPAAYYYTGSVDGGDYLTYKLDGDITSFKVITQISGGKWGNAPQDMKFAVSEDNVVFNEVNAIRTGKARKEIASYEWAQAEYTCNTIPEGMKYLKVISGDKNSTGKAWTIRISNVEIDYKKNGGSVNPDPEPDPEPEKPKDPVLGAFVDECSETPLYVEKSDTITREYEKIAAALWVPEYCYRSSKIGGGDYITYTLYGTDINYFEVTAQLCNRGGYPEDYTFFVSPDGKEFTQVTDIKREGKTKEETTPGKWYNTVYSCDNIASGSKYLRVVMPDKTATGKAWTAHLSKVVINDNYEASVISLTNQNGEEIKINELANLENDMAIEGAKAVLKRDFVKTTEEVKSVPIVALYDGDMLVSVNVCNEITLPEKDAETEIVFNLVAKAGMTNPSFKILFWNSVDTMVPALQIRALDIK